MVGMKDIAVIETGGKQYAVSTGDVITVEKLPGEVGEKIIFDRVLLRTSGADTEIGTPYLKNASVAAVVSSAGRGKRVEVVKYKAKSRYFKLRGHRQPYMKVKIAKV